MKVKKMNNRIILAFIAFLVVIDLFVSQYAGYYYTYEDALSNEIKHSDRGTMKVIKTMQIGNEQFTFIEDDLSNSEVISYQRKMIFGNNGWKVNEIVATGDVNLQFYKVNDPRRLPYVLPFYHTDYKTFGSKNNPKRLYTATISKDKENTLIVDGKKPVFIEFNYKGSDDAIWYVVKDKTASPPVITYS